MTATPAPIDLIFNALGDPTRRGIVEQLSRGPLSVSELAKPLNVTVAAILQHLDVLEKCGLARTTKVGRVRTCQIEARGLARAENWLAGRRALWTRRYDRLGKLLADPDEK